MNYSCPKKNFIDPPTLPSQFPTPVPCCCSWGGLLIPIYPRLNVYNLIVRHHIINSPPKSTKLLQISVQRWEFIKETKKVRKQENKNSTKKVIKKKRKFFLFFLVAFLVEFLFSCFLDRFLGRFLFSYFLVFFHKFPPQHYS